MPLPINVAPPNLPLASVSYDPRMLDQLTNVHKQFYNGVCNAINYILANGVFNTTTVNTSGTWTPVIQFGVYPVISDSGQTMIRQTGQYQLVGEFVIATYQIIFTSKGVSTGSAFLSNLPFPATNQGTGAMGLATYGANMSGLTGSITIDPTGTNTTTTDAAMYQFDAAGFSPLDYSNFTNNTAIYGGLIYPRI